MDEYILEPFFITEITVKNLFNEFTYNLLLDPQKGEGLRNLMILYGDNGSGKTTILNLVFHLLSPGETHGHRSYLARTPFEKFVIDFHNGYSIGAMRHEVTIGEFDMFIKGPDISKSIHIVTDDENSVQIPKGEKGREYRDFFHELSRLNIGVHLLSDTRRLRSDIYSESDEEELFSYRDSGVRLVKSRPRTHPQTLANEVAVRNLEEWIRRRVLEGSTVGAASLDSIYMEILNRIISRPSRLDQPDDIQTRTELTRTIISLSKRTEEYSKFGLSSGMKSDELLNLINSGSDEFIPIISNILIPYFDVTLARLDALENIKDTIAIFVAHLNGFYRNKEVDFNLRNGLSIRDLSGEVLNPNRLSSGERQLLLLFCSTIIAQDQASILIIDEPEISLNVKWQRDLIQSLLECVQSDTIQFLIATHSLELLAQHSSNIVQLTPSNEI